MNSRSVVRRSPWGWLPGWIALGLLVLTFGMIGFLFASSFFMPGAERLGSRPSSLEDVLTIAVSVVAFVTLPSVGAVLAARRPSNPIGWLLLVSGASITFATFGPEYVARSTLLGAELPGYRIIDRLGPLGLSFGFVLLPLWIPLLFPDGRLPSPKWRPFAWAAAATVATNLVANAVTVNERAFGSLLPDPIVLDRSLMTIAGIWVDVSNLLLVGCIAAAMVSFAVRFRRSRGVEREQMKWFLAATFVVAIALVAMTVTQQDWAYFAFLGATSLVPIAIGIAVLRYRLYEIDRLVSRTITYGLVTAVLFAAFLATTVVIGSAIGATGDDALTTAVSTLVAAALFNPVRSRVQRFVDRHFNRSRYDAQRTASGFADRLRHQLDLPMLSEELRQAAVQAVEPRATTVWLRRRGSR